MKKKLQKGLMVGLSLLMGAGVAMAIMPWAFERLDDQTLFLVIEAMVLVVGGLSILLSIIAHEAGHLVAGLMSGYHFVSFRVLSLMLIRIDGRLRFKRFSLAGTGGQCLMKPPAWTEHGIPVRLYNWGGVLANLLLVLAALPVLCLAPVTTVPGMIAASLLAVNASMALQNGLPMLNNDGDNALHLVKDLGAQHAFYQQMMANALQAQGVNSRDLPPELYQLPADADLTNPIVAAIATIAAQMPLIDHDLPAAEAAIKALLDHPTAELHPLHRFLLQNDLLYIELMGQNRADVIADIKSKQFLQYRKAMGKFPSVIRTAYVDALAAQDAAAAEAQTTLLDRVAKTYPYPQEIPLERELMERAAQRFSRS